MLLSRFFSPTQQELAVIVTTTPSIQGRRIVTYLGIVTGEAILGANIFRDMFAAVRDIVGGRSGAYEKELGKAREIALEELEYWAEDLGANAIVGVDLDYESFGQKNGMMMVSATGTAVIIEELTSGATDDE
jgi:uncharacterized protein YbjQ (UPF0145 family)